MKKIAFLLGLACACLIPTKRSNAEIFPAAVGDSLRLDINCLDSLGKPIFCDSFWMTLYRFTTSGNRVLVDSGRTGALSGETVIGTGKASLLPGRDSVYLISIPGNTTVGLYKLNVKAYGGTFCPGCGTPTKLTVEQSRWFLVGAATTTNFSTFADVRRWNGTTTLNLSTNGYVVVDVTEWLGVGVATLGAGGEVQSSVERWNGTVVTGGNIVDTLTQLHRVELNNTSGTLDSSEIGTDLRTILLKNADAGTAQAGAATSITLRAGASATNDFYVGNVVYLISSTGAGQSRQIVDYDGTTKVATVDSGWVTNPSVTSVYVVYSDGTNVHWAGQKAGKYAADSIWKSSFADRDDPAFPDTWGELATTNLQTTGWSQTGAGGGATARQVADEVWQAKRGAVAASPAPTTTAFAFNAAQSEADNFWNDNQIQVYSGGVAKQVARITAFATSNELLTITPALTAAPVTGDSFVITAVLGEAPGAGATDWTAGEKNEIRGALGISGGTPIDPTGTKQAIRDTMHAIHVEVDAMNGLAPLVITDNIGVNFSDITGTLDASEVGSAALTGAKFGTGVNGIDTSNFTPNYMVVGLRRPALANMAGNATAGSVTTITLEGGPSTTDFLVGANVMIVGGPGVGQARQIVDYNGSTFQCTVDSNWITAPTGTSSYFIYWDNAVSSHWQANAGWNTAITGTRSITDNTTLTEGNLDATITSRMASYTNPVGFLAATFPSGTIASTTNITAGTIANVTNPVTTTTGDKQALATIIADSLAQFAVNEMNLVKDPGFESRALGNVWTQVTATANIVTNAPVLSGRKVLRLSGVSAKVVSDSFYLNAGDRIVFGGNVFTSSAAVAQIGIENTAGTSKAAATYSAALNNVWVGTFEYWRADASTVYRMYLLNGSGASDTSRFDNLWVAAILDSLAAGGGGGGIDSATASRIIRRMVAGGLVSLNGSDSLTVAQRLMTSNNPCATCTFGTLFTDTVYTWNTTSSSTIPNVNVQVRNSSGTVLGTIQTNASGKFTGTFDAGTYLLYPYFTSGIAWNTTDNPDTFVVTGNGQRDTIKGATISFPAPPVGGQITVAGNVYDLLGDSVPGVTVEFSLNQNAYFSTDDTTNMVLVTKTARSRQTGVSGQWSIPLYPTTKLLGDDRRKGVYYTCKIYMPDGITTFENSGQITFSHTPTTQAFPYKNFRPWVTQ